MTNQFARHYFGKKRAAANNVFAPGGVDVWFKVLSSLFRLVPGTGRSFKSPPDRKYSRYGQFAGRVCIRNFGDDKLVDD